MSGDRPNPEEVDIVVHPEDEYEKDVDVDIVPAADVYPGARERLDTVNSMFPDLDEIECSRGLEILSMHSFFHEHGLGLAENDEVKLIDESPSLEEDESNAEEIDIEEEIEEEIEDEEGCEDEENDLLAKAKMFFKAMKTEPERMRTLTDVVLGAVNGEIPKDLLMELLSYTATKVNNRPQKMIVTTTGLTFNDLTSFLSFSSQAFDEKPLQTSLFRIYNKHGCDVRLKDFLKCLHELVKSFGRDVEVELGDIYAKKKHELVTYDGEDVRFTTDDCKSYMRLEDHARSMGFNILTSFTVTHKDRSRDVHIRWYDFDFRGERSVYTHVDFCAYGHERLRFNPMAKTVTFNVDGPMIPTKDTMPPVMNFIEYLEKCTVGQSTV